MASTNLEKLKQSIKLYNNFDLLYLINDYAFKYDFKRTIDDKIYLPDYKINLQRDYVWDLEHKVSLIRSLMYNIPVQPLTIVQMHGSPSNFLDHHTANVNFIIDGKQRLNAVIEYQQNLFPVEGVYYSELKGSYIDIEERLKCFIYNFNMKYPNFSKIEYWGENNLESLHEDTAFFTKRIGKELVGEFRMTKKIQQDFMKLFLRTNYSGVPQNNKHLHLIHNLLEE